MSLDLTVHHYTRTDDGRPPILEKVTPYARLCHDSNIVFLRGGKCFIEDGSEIDIPEWVYEQIRGMKVKGDYYGIVLPENKPASRAK